MDIAERYEKHGKAWRYVWLLEQELEKRKTRQSFIRASLALNVILVAWLIWALAA